MNTEPVIVEHSYNAPVDTVWEAITDKDKMKQWYFDIAKFKPEVGFEFQFTAGNEVGKPYLHLCKITEVIPNKKLAYTWRFDGYPGDSEIIFELFHEGDKTRVKLTHKGLENLGEANPDFKKENFLKGWTHIIGISLKEFTEKASAPKAI